MSAYSPPIRHASALQRVVQSLADAARRIAQAVVSAYQRRKRMSELDALDDRTLRDIGLHRDELGSVVTELMGAAPPTRRQARPSKTSARARR